ncbi:hemerythrin domain-containing protein [Flexithrix dorotheae]|uniref:hemerythrin domain-containing protein n=1 Tax=Flexithrix dorotheae TaxID=70993 RepID=UPI00036279D7|nr:hemerythrin domain-containing protein [Flexithrix dorotheae]
MGNKPLKRHKVLQPISREHHYHLLLCWKIRAGFRKKVDIARIKKYADWIFGNYIHPHFQLEEKYIFPLLPKGSELAKKALADHRRLTRLFKMKEDLVKSLSRIEEELEAHIRFEERILFTDLQDRMNKEKWDELEEKFEEKKFKENTEDEFWL